MQGENSTENCDIVREILGRNSGEQSETIIQTEEGIDGETAAMEQAYTCVLISEVNPDYLAQLNSNYRTKMVPIRAANLDAVTHIKLQWYSATNEAELNNTETGTNVDGGSLNKWGYNDRNSALFKENDEAKPLIPPAISVQLIQTANQFTLSDFEKNSGDSTNRGTLILQPSGSKGVTQIPNSSTTGFAASADKAINNPIPIACDNESDWSCTVTIQLPKPIKTIGDNPNRNTGSMFLRLSLLYGTPATDFSINLCRDTCVAANLEPFVGVQAKIDSTGRANDLFRRVESRVELADIYFPFPEYTLTLSGSDETLSKNFWVTNNSWTDNINSGTVED
jgi:hypothetical protein